MRAATGFSLVEVLLSLLLFSLGAMALAGMQLAAMQTTRLSSESAAALLLAEDLAQRVLAVPAAATQFELGLRDGMPAIGMTGPGPCADGAVCDYDTWILHELGTWAWLVGQRGLPSLRTCLSRLQGSLQVALSWASQSSVASADDAACVAAGSAEGRREVTLLAPMQAAL